MHFGGEHHLAHQTCPVQRMCPAPHAPDPNTSENKKQSYLYPMPPPSLLRGPDQLSPLMGLSICLTKNQKNPHSPVARANLKGHPP